MEVCSDPVPNKTTWDWGQLKVEPGQDLNGRYLAEQLVEHPEREDCYIARLVVKKVSPQDSKKYFLVVENAHGTDRYAVVLNVKGKLKWLLFNGNWTKKTWQMTDGNLILYTVQPL